MSEMVDLGVPSSDRPPPAGFDELPAPRSVSTQKLVRVAVIGEFNSGKTTLVNALLGNLVLPSSFITHTAYSTLVRYAAMPSLMAEVAGRRRVPFAWDDLDAAPVHDIQRLHVGLPLERLKSLQVIDTPGLGLGNPDQEQRTVRACRSADMVIWCTPAMQAWKASEQHIWLAMPKSLRRRGVLAITFMDTLNAPSDAARVMARLRADAGDLFHKIVATSAQGLDLLAAQTGEAGAEGRLPLTTA